MRWGAAGSKPPEGGTVAVGARFNEEPGKARSKGESSSGVVEFAESTSLLLDCSALARSSLRARNSSSSSRLEASVSGYSQRFRAEIQLESVGLQGGSNI
jgi:hypothetical protein